jgi:hypothetical protein
MLSEALTCQGTYNFRCCPPRTNCAPERLCANSSWTLYELGNYFCCADGMTAYNISGHGSCASPGAAMIEGEPLLSEVRVDPSEPFDRYFRSC